MIGSCLIQAWGALPIQAWGALPPPASSPLVSTTITSLLCLPASWRLTSRSNVVLPAACKKERQCTLCSWAACCDINLKDPEPESGRCSNRATCTDIIATVYKRKSQDCTLQHVSMQQIFMAQAYMNNRFLLVCSGGYVHCSLGFSAIYNLCQVKLAFALLRLPLCKLYFTARTWVF